MRHHLESDRSGGRSSDPRSAAVRRLGAGRGIALWILLATPVLAVQDGRPFGRVGRDRPFGNLGTREDEDSTSRPFGRTGRDRPFSRLGRDRAFGDVGRARPFGGSDELAERVAEGERRDPREPGASRRYGRVIVQPWWWTTRSAEWDLGPRSTERLEGEVEGWWRVESGPPLGPVLWERTESAADDGTTATSSGDFGRELCRSLEEALGRGDLALARAFAQREREQPATDPQGERWAAWILAGALAEAAQDLERTLAQEDAAAGRAPDWLEREGTRGLVSLRLAALCARADADGDALYLRAVLELWSARPEGGLPALERLRLLEPGSARVARLERIAVPWLRRSRR